MTPLDRAIADTEAALQCCGAQIAELEEKCAELSARLAELRDEADLERVFWETVEAEESRR